MTRLDHKLANIRAGRYQRSDFIIADAKDGDMGPSIAGCGPKRLPDGTWTRYRTRQEFLAEITALIEQDILDVMLVSASNLELLTEAGRFRNSAVKPVIRANDTSDIWVVRGGTYNKQPSRPFRSASLSRVLNGTLGPAAGAAVRLTDLGLYSITFNNDLEADIRSLEAFAEFRRDAASVGFKYFLEVFNPNVEAGLPPDVLPHFVNDCIARCLAGVVKADRPQFLKIVFNGPKALEELAGFDPGLVVGVLGGGAGSATGLVVGVLGGGAGTTRDTFELLSQAERYGARVALFGRKINLAESPLEIVRLMRQVVDGTIQPKEAVKAYHGELKKQKLKATRPLEADLEITEAVLKPAAA